MLIPNEGVVMQKAVNGRNMSGAQKMNIFKSGYRMIKDPSVSKWHKVLMVGFVAYMVSPVDPVPEAVLGPIGLVDDAGVLGVVGPIVVMMAKRYANDFFAPPQE